MNQSNLLRQLKQDDYDALIEQVRLAQKGYDFHFIIDADLVGNYCYPKGIIEAETSNQRTSKLTPDYLSDEQITLHSIFYIPGNHQRLLLLDEYYFEVEGMLYKASKVGEQKLKDLSGTQFGYFHYSSSSDLMNLLYDSFATMFTKVLMHINGIKKAKSLLDAKKIILDSNDLPTAECRDTVEGCIANASTVALIKERMYRVVNKKRKKKKSLFVSKNRDAIIMDRLLCFNRTSLNKTAKKHVYILLTDSTIMRNTLKSISRDEERITYPLVGDKKIDFCRSVPQSFAYTICLSYKEEGKIDYSTTIKNLENLRDASQQLEKRFKGVSKSYDIVHDGSTENKELTNKEIFKNYRKLRNNYENTGLLKSFNPLYESIKTEFKGKNIEDVEKIFKAFAEEGSQLFKELQDKHVYFLHKLIKVGEFNSAFIYGIERIQKGERFDLSKGSDYVEGTFHHLPLYLTFTNSEYKRKMFDLVDLVLSRKSDQSSEICNQLEGLLKVMNSSKLYDPKKTDVNLIKAFLFMIIPSRVNKGIKENDLLANSWLDDLEIEESDEEAVCNKLYLQIWALRRTKKYRDSVRLARKAIGKYTEDPRFYHGLFLSQYCLSEEKKNRDQALIKSMLENLKKAYHLYNGFVLENFKDEHNTTLVSNSIKYSYLNSYSYCLALKAANFKIDKTNDHYVKLLKEARSIFVELKDDNGKFHDELPEYFDTEAFIEYLESFYVGDPLTKIKHAKKAIEKACRLSNNDVLTKKYNHRLKMIDQRVRELIS